MAFEFRDILPAVGAVIGFGFGGPGGAALGSGIGSLARGDEADEALKNAALGYVGGKGAQFLGTSDIGKSFLGNIPGGDFIQKGAAGPDIFATGFQKGKEFLGLDAESRLVKEIDKYKKIEQSIIANTEEGDLRNKLLEQAQEGISLGQSADDSLLNMKTLLGLTGFAGIFGGMLAEDQKKNVNQRDFEVTTDTQLAGFDQPTEIKNVNQFAVGAEGGLATLAKGGFPRRNGKISGPGTETSDDIPAMLSDGEFVVNAKTVRGIGEAMGGNNRMDNRQKGADFLYGMQDKFGGKA